MTAHLRVKTLSEQAAAARDIMGQPTYAWYGEDTLAEVGIANAELILPFEFQKVHRPVNRPNALVIYLLVRDFYSGRWHTQSRWSMRGWSFQTKASYEQENQ